MSHLEDVGRSAYFECYIALSSPEKIYKMVSGVCEGVVTTEAHGRYGFGYDPIFLKHDYNQTFGELAEELKNQVSHRAKALEKLKRTLEGLPTF